MMASLRDGMGKSAPTLPEGRLTESIDTNNGSQPWDLAQVSRDPTIETFARGTRRSLHQRRLSWFSSELKDGRDISALGTGSRESRTYHIMRIKKVLDDFDSAFSENRTDLPARISSSSFRHQQHSDLEPQLTSEHKEGWLQSPEPLSEQKTSMSVVRESSSVRGEPVLGNKSSAQPPKSNTGAESRFNDSPMDSLQGELPQQELSRDGQHNNGSFEEGLEQETKQDIDNGHQSLEVSIRRVLSGSPNYAEATVAAFQRRLRGFESQSHDSLEMSDFLAGAFQRLYDQSKYDDVDHGSSSVGKQSTGKEAKTGVSPTMASASPAVTSHKVESYKRDREEDEKYPRKKASSKRSRQEMSGKHWLCPYGVRYYEWATGACRIPTKFRSFSDLKQHLLLRHCINSGDAEEPRRPELHMSNQQRNDIERVANEADKTRPRHGTQASLEKQRKTFRDVWRILFPNAGPGPKSPFCEDFIVDEIGMLSDSIFDSRSQQAFERGEVSTPNEYRANRAEFTESIQQLFAIVADFRPEFADLCQELIASATPGIISDHQLPGTSDDDGPGLTRTATDARERESVESSEPKATSSHPGSGNSPQTSLSNPASDTAGGLKIDDQETQQGIRSVMPQTTTNPGMPQTLDPRVLRDEIEWPPLGMDSMHSQREASQSMDYYCPPGAHTGAHPSDTTTSHLDQELETPFLDMMESSMPFVAGFDFDWKEGKQEDPASISADWDQLPFSQPEGETEYPWQEALQQ